MGLPLLALHTVVSQHSSAYTNSCLTDFALVDNGVLLPNDTAMRVVLGPSFDQPKEWETSSYPLFFLPHVENIDRKPSYSTPTSWPKTKHLHGALQHVHVYSNTHHSLRRGFHAYYDGAFAKVSRVTGMSWWLLVERVL